MKTIKGDLIKLAKKGSFDVIVHGCNCFNEMGAGLAKQIKKNFPEAYLADLETLEGDESKLGKYSYALWNDGPKELIIINAYTQYRYGGRRKNADNKAIKKVFKRIAKKFPDKRIGIPRIGAGMAGGNWETIKAIIEKKTKDLDITVVILPREWNEA